MEFTVRLSDEEAARIRELAQRVGVPPEELAHAALFDLVTRGGEDFRAAAEHVLTRNADLYRRLS